MSRIARWRVKMRRQEKDRHEKRLAKLRLQENKARREQAEANAEWEQVQATEAAVKAAEEARAKLKPTNPLKRSKAKAYPPSPKPKAAPKTTNTRKTGSLLERMGFTYNNGRKPKTTKRRSAPVTRRKAPRITPKRPRISRR